MPRTNPLPPPITGPVIRLTVITTPQQQTCMTVLDYMATAPATLSRTALTDFVTAWKAANMVAYRNCLPSIINTPAFIASCPSSVSVPTVNVLNSGSGNVVADQLPLEMAAILRKLTNLKGQHGAGRIYMPAVPVTFTTPGTNPNNLNGTGIDAYQALGDLLATPVLSAPLTFVLCVATRPTPPDKEVTLAQEVVGCFATRLLGTERRRREGRGI